MNNEFFESGVKYFNENVRTYDIVDAKSRESRES